MTEIVVILDNIRSLHNVGSIMRTCDGFGVRKLYTIGITPHVKQINDERLPHVVRRAETKLSKTALGAQFTVNNIHSPNISPVIDQLKQENFQICAIEQTNSSFQLSKWEPSSSKIALIMGPEVTGLSEETLALSDLALEIPMKGGKESFNVAVTCAVVIYQLSFPNK